MTIQNLTIYRRERDALSEAKMNQYSILRFALAEALPNHGFPMTEGMSPSPDAVQSTTEVDYELFGVLWDMPFYWAFLIRPKICCLPPNFGSKQQILGLIRKALLTGTHIIPNMDL